MEPNKQGDAALSNFQPHRRPRCPPRRHAARRSLLAAAEPAARARAEPSARHEDAAADASSARAESGERRTAAIAVTRD